jgi:TolA-binding protein
MKLGNQSRIYIRKHYRRGIRQGNGNYGKKNQVNMLEMKTSINQIQTTMGSIISRQDQTEERISEMEDKIGELLHASNHKEKKLIYKNSGI